MSLPTVTAARVYKNQQRALKNITSEDSMADYDGNSDRLFWEKFPHVGLSMVRIIIRRHLHFIRTALDLQL